MTTDFEIESNSALRHKGQLFDLHNNFNLARFHYDVETKEFRFSWTRTTGDWVKDNEADEIELIHKSVSYLSIGDKDEDGDFEDDNCLGDITFFPSSLRDVNDSLVNQSHPSNTDDILYIFESGRRIRICCETIELVCGKENGPQQST